MAAPTDIPMPLPSTSLTSSSSANSIKVKVILGQDIRRWRYTADSTLASLNDFISTAFSDTCFWLQYEDDEGDRLTLSSETDFADAFDCAHEEQRKSLKIYVIKGSIHAAHPTKPTKPSQQKLSSPTPLSPPSTSLPIPPSPPASAPNNPCLETKKAAIDFLRNPVIIKLLPELHRRLFDQIHKNKAALIPEWDSPDAIEQVLRHILSSDSTFSPITSHELYTKKLHLALPCFAAKISAHLPVLMSFRTEAVASWLPHLAAVISHGLNAFVSTADPLSSFFPLMCSFMSQHGDYSGYDEHGQVVHYGVQCDGCNMNPIKGKRFKCCVCSNYDLCGQCESLSKHDETHPMLKFALNAARSGPPFGGLHEMMSQYGHAPHHWFGNQWKQRGRRHQHGMAGGAMGGHHGMQHGWCNQGGNQHAARAWKRFGNRYQNQYQSGYEQPPHSAHSNPWNAWCVNRQDAQNQHNACGSNSHHKQGSQKIKVSAEFISDITLPDRTKYAVNTILTKTWKMRNSGDHEWGEHVELVFFKGNESLTLEKRYPVINAQPQQAIEVSAVVKTPEKPGRYCSYYRLQRAGEYFGPRVWVDIFAVEDCNVTSPSKESDKASKQAAKAAQRVSKLDKRDSKLAVKEACVARKIERIGTQASALTTSPAANNKNKKMAHLQKHQARLLTKQAAVKGKRDALKEKRDAEEQLLDDIVNAAVQEVSGVRHQKDGIECVCGAVLVRMNVRDVYSGIGAKVNCDICGKFAEDDVVYHCPNEKRSSAHPEGYDLCGGCAQYQMMRFEDASNDKKSGLKGEVFGYGEELAQLKSMGFQDESVMKEALMKQKGNVQRVANQLLLQQ